jgi:ribose transport system permease protein
MPALDASIPMRAAPSARAWLSGEGGALAYRVLFILALCLLLGLASDSFATTSNLLNLLRQTSLVFLLASGLTLVIIAGGIDLSVAANLTLSACLAAGVMKGTGSVTLGVLTALGCGTLAGLANGLAVTRLKLPPFLATYGSLWILQGLAFRYMGGHEIFGFPPAFRALGTGFWLGVPVPVYLMALVTIVLALVMRKTVFGHHLYAIGANYEAARLSGVPAQRRRIAVYALSGAMAGLAALVYLARVNSADAGLGESLLLPTIAAVLIGGTSLFGGSGGVIGTFTGALILAITINAMNLFNVKATWQPLVIGCVVILAVLVDLIGGGKRERIG